MDSVFRRQCLVLSRFCLQGFDLDALERTDEAERLTEALQETIRLHLEALDHRRRKRAVGA